MISNMKNIIKLLDVKNLKEGLNPTGLEEVKIYKSSVDSPRNPLIYNQGILIILEGEKRIYTPHKTIIYNNENYLVLTVPLPLECEAIREKSKPIIGITIDIKTNLLNQIINELDDLLDQKKLDVDTNKCGLYTASVTSDFKQVLHRLIQSIQNPMDLRVLAQNNLKELIYLILKDKNSGPLYSLAFKNTNLSKIELALKEIHRNYNNQFDVSTLANTVNMSVSAFHQAFKEVTSDSPIQYLKNIRLNKARTLLIESDIRINEVAREVGYESVSQFNREFKRYFGHTPSQI